MSTVGPSQWARGGHGANARRVRTARYTAPIGPGRWVHSRIAVATARSVLRGAVRSASASGTTSPDEVDMIATQPLARSASAPARHHDGRRPVGGGDPGHAGGHLTGRRLSVHRALTGDDEIGPVDRLGQADRACDQVDPGLESGPQEGHEREAQPPGRPGARLAGELGMPAQVRPVRQHRVEAIDVLRPRALLRAEDGTGAAIARQGVVDVAGDVDRQALQPRVETGGIDGCERSQLSRRRPDDSARAIQEADAELGQHAGAAIIGGRTADAQQQTADAGVQRRADHPADTPGVGAENVTLALGNELEPRGRGHLEHGGAVADRQTARDGTPQRVHGPHGANPCTESRRHGLGEPFAAIGHGHVDDLGVRHDGEHSPGHGGRRLNGRHGLLEGVGGDDDLHRALSAHGSVHDSTHGIPSARCADGARRIRDVMHRTPSRRGTARPENPSSPHNLP